MPSAPPLAPSARYYPCNETLRPLFLHRHALARAGVCRRAGAVSAPRQLPTEKFAHRHQGAACRAGFQYGNAQLQIAGWPRWTKARCCARSSTGCSPYKFYCKRLAAQLGVAGTSATPARWTPPPCARRIWRPTFSCCRPAVRTAPTAWAKPCCWPALRGRRRGIPSMLEDGREGYLYGDALDEKRWPTRSCGCCKAQTAARPWARPPAPGAADPRRRPQRR